MYKSTTVKIPWVIIFMEFFINIVVYLRINTIIGKNIRLFKVCKYYISLIQK